MSVQDIEKQLKEAKLAEREEEFLRFAEKWWKATPSGEFCKRCGHEFYVSEPTQSQYGNRMIQNAFCFCSLSPYLWKENKCFNCETLVEISVHDTHTGYGYSSASPLIFHKKKYEMYDGSFYVCSTCQRLSDIETRKKIRSQKDKLKNLASGINYARASVRRTKSKHSNAKAELKTKLNEVEAEANKLKNLLSLCRDDDK